MSRLDVRGINENVLENFKDSVKERYGKLHTVMGLEVEKALALYLEGLPQTTCTHTQEKKEEKVQKGKNLEQNHKPKILDSVMAGKTRVERINNVGEMLMNGTPEITDAGLRRFIATQGVGDERVIESYIKTMKLRGWLVGGLRNNNKEIVVMRSAISAALDIQLPQEILEGMVGSYRMPEIVEGNGGRH